MKKGLIVLFILLVIPFIHAVSVSYNFNQNPAYFDVYKCGTSCNDLTLLIQSEANNNLQYNYAENGLYMYAAYSQCSYPIVRNIEISELFDNTNVNIDLSKKQSCNVNIDSLTASGNLKTGNNILVKSVINGPFDNDFNPSSFLGNMKENRKEYLTSNINIKLYDNDALFGTKNIVLYSDEPLEVDFSYKTSTNGNHNLRIEISSDDCKCANFQTQNKEINVNVQGNNLNSPASQSNRITQNQDLPQETGTTTLCEEGDGCNPKCEKGDKDCSCSIMSGHKCNEDESCKGTLLVNYDNSVCCSIPCIEGTNINSDTLVRYFTTEKVPKENKQIKDLGVKVDLIKENLIEHTKSLLALIGLAFIFLLVSVIFAMHESHFPIDPYQKTVNFIKNEEALFKKKKVEKKEVKETTNTKLDDFLEDIIEKLSKDEEKVVRKLLKGSIKQDELKDLLNFSKEKLNYNLIRLERRQIIKKRSGDNPKIELNDWLLK